MTRHATHEQSLKDLAAQARNGAVAVFAGPSGTGKNRAAQLLADAVGTALITANLASIASIASIASKYIGETEKHINKLLQEAQTTGAVLLFDEADALFGKRTGVKDSHGKYANLEVSHLLQRLERSGAIVILSTNKRDGIDSQVIARCHCVLRFPPD